MAIDRDKIMNRKQFYKLGRADQRALMAHWRIIFTTEQIKKELGISTTAFYALLKRLDLPTNLKAYKDSQPSLLGEDTTHPKMNSNPPTTPSNDYDVEVSLVGRVGIKDLSETLKMAHDLNLDITIKS